MTKVIISRLVALLATIFAGVGIYYFCLPAWNLRSVGLYLFFTVMSLIAMLFLALAETFNDNVIISVGDKKNFHFYTVIKFFGVLASIFAIVIIVGELSSAQLFRAASYQSLIEIEEGDFENEIASNNIDEIAVVDVDTAKRLGDRTIASLENPSWYEVDNEYNLILYHDKQYRLSPLNYGGIFKYFKASSIGIPGYVLVDAISQEATLVTLEDNIMYSPSALFGHDLKRHLRSQYPTYIFGSSFFEIDENGKPYWVTSVKNITIGLFGGGKEESFIVTDAYSGKSQEYTVDSLPEFIDHAFDVDYLMQMTYYNLEYIDGFLNHLTSKTGVNRTSYCYRNTDPENYFAGYNTTISSDGIVFYTGVTPANAAESINGFILASPRTGVVKYYPCSGAEESSAQSAVESLVQNYGYQATFPTVINIEGIPTYFMTLKDNSGLIQRYAFSNIANYSISVQAPTLDEALAQYLERIGSSSEIVSEDETVEFSSISGEISSLYTAQIDGYTYFYFTLVGDNNLYMSSIENSNRQVLLTVGSNVNIEYTNSSESGVFLVRKIDF